MTENGNGSTEEQAERKPTERVVLKQEAVLLVSGLDPEKVDEAIKLLGVKVRKGQPRIQFGWVEVARHLAPTKLAAIEAHAGKAGTADALQGVFRAPTVTAWKDAEVYTAPPAPLVERTTVE